MKVVINACFGGFSLSPEATLELWRRGGPVTATPVAEFYGKSGNADADLAAWRVYLANPALRRSLAHTTVFSPDETLALYAGRCNNDDGMRSHPELVKLVEEMGEAAWGACAKLKVVEVPDDVDWEIDEYDGSECVSEKHRSWS
jgi:hypothetical protein